MELLTSFTHASLLQQFELAQYPVATWMYVQRSWEIVYMPFPAAYTEAEVKLIVADRHCPPTSSLQPETSSFEFM